MYVDSKYTVQCTVYCTVYNEKCFFFKWNKILVLTGNFTTFNSLFAKMYAIKKHIYKTWRTVSMRYMHC